MDKNPRDDKRDTPQKWKTFTIWAVIGCLVLIGAFVWSIWETVK